MTGGADSATPCGRIDCNPGQPPGLLSDSLISNVVRPRRVGGVRAGLGVHLPIWCGQAHSPERPCGDRHRRVGRFRPPSGIMYLRAVSCMSRWLRPSNGALGARFDADRPAGAVRGIAGERSHGGRLPESVLGVQRSAFVEWTWAPALRPLLANAAYMSITGKLVSSSESAGVPSVLWLAAALAEPSGSRVVNGYPSTRHLFEVALRTPRLT
jgi:hypothetical protein